MTNLFNLQCPTCGASLQADGSSKQIACEHCGNQYLLDKELEQMDDSQRENLSPAVTYANKPGQWIKVAGVDVLLHSFSEETISKQHVLCVEVEYENKTSDSIKYRHDQWIVFDKTGYTYEATMDYLHPKLYQGKIYIGRQRILNPGMKLRGWLVFILPAEGVIECLQFSAGTPSKTLEFRI